MEITVLDSGFVTGDFLKPLGYAGERNSRKLFITHPHFRDCYYQLIVKRFDELYKIGIDDGEAMVPPSLLRTPVSLQCQFVAISKPDSITDTETDTFLFESRPFSMNVDKGLDLNSCSPIPTYEELQMMYKNLENAKLAVEHAKADNAAILESIEQAIKEAHEDPVTELSEEVLQGYREQLENVSKDYLSNGLIDDIANEVVERIGECQCGDVAKMTTDELKAMIRTIMSEMKEEISKGEANWLSITHHSMSENGNIIGG